MSLSEAEMMECENGHIFCEAHQVKDISEMTEGELINFLESKDYSKDEITELLKKDMSTIEDELEIRYYCPNAMCPICSFTVVCEEDMVNYLIKTTKISKLDVFKAVKQENKRRKKLHNSEYIAHACKTISLSEEQIEKEIIGKFENYEKFLEFLS